VAYVKHYLHSKWTDRIRLPPGSCLRQFTIPTTPLCPFVAMSQTGISDDSAKVL